MFAHVKCFMPNAQIADSRPIPNRFPTDSAFAGVGLQSDMCAPPEFSYLLLPIPYPDCPVGSVEKFQHVGIFGPTEG